MTRRRLAIAALAILALILFWSWHSSDRRRIARELDHLQDLISKSGSETALVGLNRSRQITALFASHFEVRAEQLRFSTRDRRELAGFIHAYRRGSERIAMRISGTSLTLDPDLGRATQLADFHFTGGGPLGSPSERYRAQINWLEEEGRWRIDYIDLLEVLDPAGSRLGF